MAAQRDEWFSKGNNEYFELITSTMVKTNPGLRQVLRDRYYVGDGRFDGVAARDSATEW